MSHASRPLHVGRALALIAAAEPIECPNCGETECDCSDEDRELAELSECTGQEAKSRFDGQVKFQRCAFVERTDWMGDPNVYRGTVYWKVAKCLVCGVELQQPYPKWLEAKLPQREDA